MPKSIRIHYIQHVLYETLGCIEDWAQKRGHSLTATKCYENAAFFPETNTFDLLVILGGPMNVNDHLQHPWIDKEKKFVQQAIASGKTIIGICLGAQMIASTLGYAVYPNREKEIGWFPVDFTDGTTETVFHWHGETFDLPYGAQRLASSEACLNQAYTVGDKILGLQFHLEVTRDSLSKMVTFGQDELTTGNYIQPEADIRQTQYIARNNQLMYDILNRLENV